MWLCCEMESEMITPFLISLFATFIVIRIFSHLWHDLETYGTPEEKSKTITCWLRRKTGIDFHHLHFGVLILIIIFPLILINGFNIMLIIFLGIGLSLIADQIVTLIFRKICYFSRLGIFWAILLHLIIALIFVFIL